MSEGVDRRASGKALVWTVGPCRSMQVHAGPHVSSPSSILSPAPASRFDSPNDIPPAPLPPTQCCLPGRKQVDALVYCRAELADHLVTQAALTKEQLGDPK